MVRRKSDVAREKDGRSKLSGWLRSNRAKCDFIMLLGSMVLFLLFMVASAPQRYDLEIGSISLQTITATKDVFDTVRTEENRKAAAAAVEPTYILQEGAAEEVMSHLNQVFDEMRNVQLYGLTLRTPEDTEATLRSRTYTDSEISNAQGLLSSITLSRYQITTLLRTDTADFDTMVSTLTIAVSNALNSSIRENQVSQSIDIIRQIAGYSVKLTLMQNIVPTVLRTCVKANLVIDQEKTNEARQKAMDAEPVVMYIQGDVIVGEGEVVEKNQYSMLKELGLLEDATTDWTMYIGAAVLVAVALMVLLILLALLQADIFNDVRRTSVMVLVMILNLVLCILSSRLVKIYIAPVTLSAMLLTGLLGWRAGLASSVCMALLHSGLSISGSTASSAEMVQLLIMGIASGTVVACFLRHKSQRMSVVLCGLVISVTNVLALVAVSLMTSYDQTGLVSSIGWSIAGAMFSSVVALGLQPVFEAVFNLATPSKLMELANPNQPLLRRLLIEAPGTYHHSIIVANLAEAAAEKIGANPLLARTASYFHDVGKLKRPLYFKENQMGENPHDTTDPYVSAAIVTSHTRDGVALAQKHRLPQEIQEIIAEHHGDTPVMYFYHKALQQADGKPVEISDFRYDGKRPGSKESAIIMLADTVEAAVRSMPDPTPQAIEKFIERLVRGKLEDGQLNNAPLTLRDIDNICIAFGTVLNGVFHERIEYPNVEIPGHVIAQAPMPEEPVHSKEEALAASSEAVEDTEESNGTAPAPEKTAEQPEPVKEATEDEHNDDSAMGD